MNQNRLTFLAVAAVGAVIVLANTLYVVGQQHQAIVLRLGEPVRTVNAPGAFDPGLKLKVPFVEKVVLFDRRNLGVEVSKLDEVLTADQQRLVVDAFVRYRITNPLRFYQSLRDETTADDRLQRLINSSLREALGRATTEEVIAKERDVLMRRVRDDLARRVAASRFGVEIVDFRIKRADLPQANQDAVYDRMKTQRQQIAAQERAKGNQQALEILGAATKEAETIRGQADAQRAEIFAESFGKDPGFASFYRSMQAYETSLGKGDTTLVLSPDSQFFRYFSGGPSR
jgi:membrane protease subunit HflC